MLYRTTNSTVECSVPYNQYSYDSIPYKSATAILRLRLDIRNGTQGYLSKCRRAAEKTRARSCLRQSTRRGGLHAVCQPHLRLGCATCLASLSLYMCFGIADKCAKHSAYAYACMHDATYACMHVATYACMHDATYACMHDATYACMHDATLCLIPLTRTP
jgi:hypothetical protein